MEHRTFREYLNMRENQDGLDPEFARRLLESGEEIDSLNALVGFAKERRLDHYSKDWRRSMAHMANGREKMAVLWARYLALQEEREEV